ncbi:MAG: hypothetical protein L6R30_15975 [Thermoanaerobaculia bacterium]|nr:hypothetical protein [Thermoanaerobaculia bacterium]
MRFTSSLSVTTLLGLVLLSSSPLALGASIQDVTVRPNSFNVALKQKAVLSFQVMEAGHLTVSVLDRDGYLVRRVADKKATTGLHTLEWDGHDGSGNLVPDEAYTFRIDLRSGKKTYTYSPAKDTAGEMFDITKVTYDRREGVISYSLPRPSRVHVQTGTAKLDPTGTKREPGPVLRTIVDRQPRTAGAIVEVWNGYNESGDILVPELKDFVLGVACFPLPENTVITLGNRKTSFRTYALKRKGKRLMAPGTGTPGHHGGLTSLQDASPNLTLSVQAKEAGEPYKVTMRLPADAANVLNTLGGRIVVFVDGVMTSHHAPGPLPMTLSLPSDLEPGKHVVAINWATGKGPTGVGTLSLDVPQPSRKVAQK